jgi:hypothetical protein
MTILAYAESLAQNKIKHEIFEQHVGLLINCGNFILSNFCNA